MSNFVDDRTYRFCSRGVVKLYQCLEACLLFERRNFVNETKSAEDEVEDLQSDGHVRLQQGDVFNTSRRASLSEALSLEISHSAFKV